jgi:hypothetical protein
MPHVLTATLAVASVLAESAVAIFAGTYPGATTYPGADVYPGRGNDLVSLTATTNVLTEAPA